MGIFGKLLRHLRGRDDLSSLERDQPAGSADAERKAIKAAVQRGMRRGWPRGFTRDGD